MYTPSTDELVDEMNKIGPSLESFTRNHQTFAVTGPADESGKSVLVPANGGSVDENITDYDTDNCGKALAAGPSLTKS